MGRVVKPYNCKSNDFSFQLIVHLLEFGHMGIFANKYPKYGIFDKLPNNYYVYGAQSLEVLNIYVIY